VATGRVVSRAALGLGREERALARRFLRALEGTWHDGDENRVRGHLDHWRQAGEAGAGAARALLEAAGALSAAGARAETLWFYLWEMETMLESVAAPSRRPRPGGL
jgi:hypothetical protein